MSGSREWEELRQDDDGQPLPEHGPHLPSSSKKSDELLPMHTGHNVVKEFPCCVLWAPIPLISHMIPFIGHTMITDSEGHLYDFAGYAPGSGRSGVVKDVGIFGSAVRVLRCTPAEGTSQASFVEDWDKAIWLGNRQSERKVHKGAIDNCHSHICAVLRATNRAVFPRVPEALGWNILVAGFVMTCLADWVPSPKGMCFRTWFYLWCCFMLAWIVLRQNPMHLII